MYKAEYKDPYLIYTGLRKNDYETIWFDSDKNISIIKPIPEKNYVNIGNIILTENTDLNTIKVIFVKNDERYIHRPLNYYKMFSNEDISIWRIIPPTHHIAFSDIIKIGNEKPQDIDNIICINEDYVKEYEYYNVKLYETDNFTVWRMNEYNTFTVNLSKYPSNLIKYEPKL